MSKRIGCLDVTCQTFPDGAVVVRSKLGDGIRVLLAASALSLFWGTVGSAVDVITSSRQTLRSTPGVAQSFEVGLCRLTVGPADRGGRFDVKVERSRWELLTFSGVFGLTLGAVVLAASGSSGAVFEPDELS